jgi:hypothetical protein
MATIKNNLDKTSVCHAMLVRLEQVTRQIQHTANHALLEVTPANPPNIRNAFNASLVHLEMPPSTKVLLTTALIVLMVARPESVNMACMRKPAKKGARNAKLVLTTMVLTQRCARSAVLGRAARVMANTRQAAPTRKMPRVWLALRVSTWRYRVTMKVFAMQSVNARCANVARSLR